MTFRGWPAEALEFYDGLEADNSKAYWSARKEVYETAVRAPMLALLADLEPQLGPGKVFRPNRDVRFSADKSPYKTAIGATVGDGNGYVQLSARGLAAGVGMYALARDQLARYRRAVDDDLAGGELTRVVARLSAAKIPVTGHDSLRTVPRGYPADHPRIALLRYKGITAWQQWPAGAWLESAQARDRVRSFLRTTRPLCSWLADHVRR